MQDLINSVYNLVGGSAGFSASFAAKVFFALGLGGFVAISLIFCGQRWAKSLNYVSTFCILPVISLGIKKMISGNIALSLGMVGALSIVRFRHPVKSSLELTIYFLLVTLGIGALVSPASAAFIAAVSMLTLYLYSLYTSYKNGFLGFIPTLSRSDNDPIYLLEINSEAELESIDANKNTILSHKDLRNSLFTYKLSFSKKQEVIEMEKIISTFKGVTEIRTSLL